MASKFISILAQSRSWSSSLSSPDHALKVYLQRCSITAIWCIFKLARSLPQCVFLSSLDCQFEARLAVFCSTACSQSIYTVCRWVATQIHRWEYKLHTWVIKIVEWYVVAMISRCTSSIPKEDVAIPRLLYCDSRCSQTCCWRSETCHLCSQSCC
jgi:hypothetical protein